MPKRILSICLSIFLSIGALAVNADVAAIETIESPVAWSDNAGLASLSQWGGYIFAATNQGLKIFDIGGSDKPVAQWRFSSSVIPGAGISSFNPSQVIVTDNYIIIAFGVVAVVFPNEGRYGAAPPSPLAAFTGTAGELRMHVNGSNLYLLSRPTTADGDGMRIGVCWKIGFNKFESYAGYTNRVVSLPGELSNGVSRVEFGDCRSLWHTIVSDDDYIYCGTARLVGGGNAREHYLTLVRINIKNFGTAELLTVPTVEESAVSSGAMTISDGILYVISNEATTGGDPRPRLICIDTGSFSVKNSYTLDPRVHNAYQAITTIDNVLFGLMKNTSATGSFEIISPGAVNTNMAKLFSLQTAVTTSNGFAGMVKFGGRLYYPLTNSTGLGVIKTNKTDVSMNVYGSENNLPFTINGTCTAADTISLTIGSESVTVPVRRGSWSYPIFAMPNGAYTVRASIGGQTFEEQMKINVPSAAVLSDISLSGGKLSGSIVNNTDRYDGAMRTTAPMVAVGIYAADGSMPGYEEKYISTASFEFDADIPADGCARLYAFNDSEGMKPLSAIHTVTAAGAVTSGAQPKAAGYANLTDVSARAVPVENKVYIEGQLQGGAFRDVAVKIIKGSDVKAVDLITADANGSFSYPYSHENDVADGAPYYALIGGVHFEEAIPFEISNDGFDEMIEAIKQTITSGAALGAFLTADNAAMLGINLESAAYLRLNSANRNVIMDKMLALIKTDKAAEAAATFETESAFAADAQELSELNSAQVSTLTGILDKFHTRGFITDETFAEYKAMGQKIASVNEIFIGNGPLTENDIETRLKAAMTTANTPAPSVTTSQKSGGSGSGGGGGGTSKINAAVASQNINLTQTAEKPADLGFTDLSEAEWARESIMYLKGKGLVSGVSENTFAPNDFVTREQFVKMLISALELTDGGASSSFSDVLPGEWYYEYVASAEKLGLAMGSGGVFGIGEQLTREQMCTFAARGIEIAGIQLASPNEKIDFNDSGEISDYAAESVEFMQRAGIINGMGNAAFAPKELCTRAMAARVIYGIINGAPAQPAEGGDVVE